MIARFEELDWQPTRMGDLTLRRRTEPPTGDLVYEVKLGDEYLMSSLFTVAEEELATLGLAAVDRRRARGAGRRARARVHGGRGAAR